MWSVEYTDEFGAWFAALTERQQDAIDRGVRLLEELWTLSRNSRHPNMKELRTQCGGRPLRTFFIFDPRRTAILLVGGDKTADRRFYQRMIPIADDLYDQYLKELRNEGLLP